MTPQIFPGLQPPTSQLFFDLQAFIAENGGADKLVDLLILELIKIPKKRKKRSYRKKTYKHYTAEDIANVKAMIVPNGKNKRAVYYKRWQLKSKGLL